MGLLSRDPQVRIADHALEALNIEIVRIDKGIGVQRQSPTEVMIKRLKVFWESRHFRRDQVDSSQGVMESTLKRRLEHSSSERCRLDLFRYMQQYW
jgi:hypothetical protein